MAMNIEGAIAAYEQEKRLAKKIVLKYSHFESAVRKALGSSWRTLIDELDKARAAHPSSKGPNFGYKRHGPTWKQLQNRLGTNPGISIAPARTNVMRVTDRNNNAMRGWKEQPETRELVLGNICLNYKPASNGTVTGPRPAPTRFL